MALRMIRPDQERLDIGDGDWLLVKKRLTAGETRRVFARMIRPETAFGEKLQLDPMQVTRSQAMEYLLDWSQPEVKIAGLSPDQIGAVLDDLDPVDFKRITDAVAAHEQRMDLERTMEKNAPGGETNSIPTSPSAA